MYLLFVIIIVGPAGSSFLVPRPLNTKLSKRQERACIARFLRLR
jgi:hypothetical protein